MGVAPSGFMWTLPLFNAEMGSEMVPLRSCGADHPLTPPHRMTSQITVHLFHKGFTSFKGKMNHLGAPCLAGHSSDLSNTSLSRGEKPLQWIQQLLPHRNIRRHWLQKFPQSSDSELKLMALLWKLHLITGFPLIFNGAKTNVRH